MTETKPPPPPGRETAVARLVVGVLALGLGAGAFAITSGLALGWRILLAVLVAAPLLLLVDLLRGASAPRPDVKPRAGNDRGASGSR